LKQFGVGGGGGVGRERVVAKLTGKLNRQITKYEKSKESLI